MNNKTYNRNTFFSLLLIFPIAAISKWYQYNYQAGHGFGIMNYIKGIVDTGNFMGVNSYDFPAKFYSFFKFMGFSTNLQWSIFFTVIFSIIMFLFLLKYKTYNFKELIYIYASMFIMCWTVMNANKDLIQLIFMLIIYSICSSKISNTKKISISAAIFIFESLVFREYYILVAGLSMLVYLIINKELKNNGKKKIIRNIFIVLLFFFIAIFACKYIIPSSYDDLINRRNSLDNFDNVTTIIQNKIPGGSYPVFILNYLINFFRILLPIEIILYGPKYMIFIVYQLMTTFVLVKSFKNLNKKNICYLAIVIAYTMMMVASESDFGTLVRHQSVLLMFYLSLFKESSTVKIENIKGGEKSEK